MREELRKCDSCARRKLDLVTDPELLPLPLLPSLEGLSMDVFGPLPLTPRGNKYVCVAIDRFTKWPEAKALPHKTSERVARFADELICRFCPREIRTDQGPEFSSKFRSLLKHRGVKHVFGTSYSPQSNGAAEKTVQNVLHGLQKIASGPNPTNWDDHIPGVLYGLRCAPQASSKMSPYMMLYRKEPLISAELKRLPAVVEEEEGLELPKHYGAPAAL